MDFNPTRVLFVSATLSGGGAQRFTSTLLEHLDRQAVTPSLALLRDEVSYPLPADVEVHHIRYIGVLTFIAAAARLTKLMESCRTEVVVSNVNAVNLITGWAIRNTHHRPAWVARVGTNPSLHDNRFRKWVGGKVYPFADRIVTNSRGLAGTFQKTFHVGGALIETIPTPTDMGSIARRSTETPCLTRSGEEPLLVAVGRLFPEKRYDVMLRALARVREVIPAKLWICGDGPLTASLRSLSKDLGLSEAVEWLGYVENPYSVMAQADLFVLTSDHEGLPNALIEAQSLGLPAVSTRCPHGPDEIIEDGVTGLLVPVGDVEAVAQRILKVLTDPHRREEMSVASAKRARARFECSRLTAEWQNLIVSLAGERGQRQ